MKKIILISFLLALLIPIKEVKACHAIALVNFNQQNLNANSIILNAASDSPTCGCDEYWLDLEVRCLNESFDAAPFSPGFHGPLNSYPYFQSATMMKPNCVIQNYPGITIPFAGLCPGITYQYRMRENHNGQVGPWTAAQTFTVPGATQPIIAGINASTTTICAGDCVNLDAIVQQGCGLADTYTWSSGQTTPSITVCPTVTTTYTVTIDEQCSNFQDQTSITINVVPPPINGTATISQNTICAGTPISLDITGYSGTIQWQSSPNPGGPWTNIPGATNSTYNDPNPTASTCYRVEITGCAPLPLGIQSLYSNVVCVTVDPPPIADFTFNAMCGQPTSFFDQSGSGSGSGIAGWEWDIDGDGVIDYTTQNPNHLFSGSGPYNTTLIVTNNTGCKDTITSLITIVGNSPPSYVTTTVCSGSQYTFADGSIQTINGATTYTSTLQNGVGCDSTIEETINVFPTQVITENITLCSGGSYTFPDGTTQTNITNNLVYSSILQNINGCDSIIITDLNLLTIPPTNVNISLCSGANYTFPDGSVQNNIINNVIQSSILQSINGCDSIINTNLFINPIYNQTATQTLCPGDIIQFPDGNIQQITQNTTYISNLITINGCDSIITTDINVYQDPEFDINISENGCQPNPIQIENLTPGFNCFITIVGPGINVTYNTCGVILDTLYNPGLYDIYFEMSSPNGCLIDTSILEAIEVYPLPISSFNWDPQEGSLTNNSINFYNESIGGSTYIWDLGNGESSNNFSPSQTYQDTGIYDISLITFNEFGCSDTSYGEVVINPEFYLFVPNSFTPDGDGLNSLFGPEYLGTSKLQLYIFDRWGELIYETQNNVWWDGTYRGYEAKQDVYVWKIVLKTHDNQKKEFYGHVTLLR